MKLAFTIIIEIIIFAAILFFTQGYKIVENNDEMINENVVSGSAAVIQNDIAVTHSNGQYPQPERGCLAAKCHNGIEPIRDMKSDMMKEIIKEGKKAGDPNGCVVCHYGNPKEENDKSKAHKGLIIHPGSMTVLDKTCGKCHEDHQYAMHRNLMQTEAGKIQGATWGWGAKTGYKGIYGNYNIEDTDGDNPLFGTADYKKYMHKLMKKYPDNFPKSLKELPQAPSMERLNQHPEEAVFTYLRQECLRCHVGVRGKQRRGDYRGMGCASCHIPYSNEGKYEGNDKTIPKDEPGHLLVHSIQSSRKTKVTVNDITYSGIPNETCTTCHNRGKRIGMSYLGLMESAYDTPWNSDGSSQTKLHGKRYHYIQDDAHHNIKSRDGNPKGGLLCQDCHTTTSVHGNGNISTSTLGEVEIECQDCHGIPDKYPWELPLGYSDEFGTKLEDKARGLSDTLLPVQKDFSTVYKKEEGYLLTARGNPFGNVVKKGGDIIVHSASGLDFKMPTLKKMNIDNLWKNPVKAKTAMVANKAHMEKMECYACHATWAPQCYGCHVQVDYSDGKQGFDWVKAGKITDESGETSESCERLGKPMIKGKVREGRSYLRWEDPVLGINGEGRVTPIIPGCQQITTVIGEDGKPLVYNKIWHTPPGLEGGGKEGQKGIDMTPVQPHTITAKARECTSCHTNPKALGYGIGDNEYRQGYTKDIYTDLRTADGKILSKNARPQLTRTDDLDMDLSMVVTGDGKQMQTVGHHWPLSSPLTQYQRDKMERVGTCIACHQELPNGDVAVSMITSAAEFIDMVPHSDKEHATILRQDILLAAWVKILAPILLLLAIFLYFWFRRKRMKKNQE